MSHRKPHPRARARPAKGPPGFVVYVPSRQERRGKPHRFGSKARKGRSKLEVMLKDKGWPRRSGLPK